MTATNQAFIRAYRQPDNVAADVPAPKFAQTGERVDTSSLVTARQVATFEFVSTCVSTVESIDVVRDDCRSWRVDTPLDVELPDFDTPTLPVSTPTTIRSAKAPLSEVMADRQAQLTVPETTVAGFRLPLTCQRLLADHDSLFDATVAGILHAVSNGHTLIGVAGCGPQTGSTTVLLCLAQRLADIQKKLIVVDANFRQPSLIKKLGISATTNWHDVLCRGAPLAEALVRSRENDLTVLPLSKQREDPLFESARLQASVTAGALRYEYDVALVDLGSLSPDCPSSTALQLADAMRIDAVLLVANSDMGSNANIQYASNRMAEMNCTTLGAIENFMDDGA